MGLELEVSKKWTCLKNFTLGCETLGIHLIHSSGGICLHPLPPLASSLLAIILPLWSSSFSIPPNSLYQLFVAEIHVGFDAIFIIVHGHSRMLTIIFFSFFWIYMFLIILCFSAFFGSRRMRKKWIWARHSSHSLNWLTGMLNFSPLSFRVHVLSFSFCFLLF